MHIKQEIHLITILNGTGNKINMINLKELEIEYKKKLEKELRKNQMKGIVKIIDKVLGELFKVLSTNKES